MKMKILLLDSCNLHHRGCVAANAPPRLLSRQPRPFPPARAAAPEVIARGNTRSGCLRRRSRKRSEHNRAGGRWGI